MTDTDFHARRTELANRMATAGADLLDFMGSAGALVAIPNTAQYVVAGDPRAIRAQLETVDPQRRMRHGDRPEQPLYFGPESGQARRWAALITSAGHGILQEYGTAFEHAQPGQEVLEVMEILPGAPAIANKATEEGELPFGDALDTIAANAAREVGGMFTDSIPIKSLAVYARAVAKQVRAADRASRRVANKAEVEPVAYIYPVEESAIPDWPWPFMFVDASANPAILDALAAFPIYATPPATTGASTAREQALEEAARVSEEMYESGEGGSGTKEAAKRIRALKGAAPASTVLTEERIKELVVVSCFDSVRMGNAIDFARAIEREVAAQAGQVAVPGDLTACANCLRPKCEHNGKLCPRPFTTHWHAWDYENQTQPGYPEYAAPSPAKESK